MVLKPPLFFNLLASLGHEPRSLNFRFPIETLDSLLRKFYKNFKDTSFLLQANKDIPNLTLKRISKSYLLKVPLDSLNNEDLYIGLSDKLAFLILFDEPEIKHQGVNGQKSRFFISFDPEVIKVVFNYFYKNYCSLLSVREKRLLIKLKNVGINQIDSHYASAFLEDLLINALSDNNKLKNERILEALSFTNESIAITDLAGNIKESNKNFVNQFGTSLKQGNVRDLLPDDLVKTAFAETTKNQRWSSEVNICVTSKAILLFVSCCLFKDELNRPDGFVFTFKDVTELKKLDNLNKQLIAKLRERNVELSDVNKRLIETSQIKSDLLSVVSHELKTPVSTIIGFCELIMNRELDEETMKGYAEQINSAAKNLDRIVTDYLDVAANHFGVLSSKLSTMPINLAELIRVCYEEQKLNFKDINFQFELTTVGYEPVIISEAENMKKLFGNLINNALKYCPYGGKVSVKILNDSENLTLSVSDEGVGLTSEQAKQVFEPFYRANNTITREFPGIGLGLAVCKKIVEIYNGSIWCEPGVDIGTTFFVTLPVNPFKPKEIIKSAQEKKLDARPRNS